MDLPMQIHSLVDSLSQEILDAIIDLLRYDEQALRACSMVSRALLPRCQAHLFRRIALDVEDLLEKNSSSIDSVQGNRIGVLREILHCTPHIAHCVRHLVIRISSNDRHSEWLSKDPIFLDCMTMIGKNLQKLLFFGTYEYPDLYSPVAISDIYHQALETQFWRPSIANFITSLRLYRVGNVPVSFITSCRQLTDLDLSYTTLKSPDALELPILFRPKLKKYAFTKSSKATEILLQESTASSNGCVDLEGLEVLTCSPKEDFYEDIPCIERILSLTVNSLTGIVLSDGSGQFSSNFLFSS
ncbi:hypothetical protein GALMADRAFT_453378 [Galerina marginata CBS 339.88]|uniref:F-box domain-containing protein n=1 Tax=Galerina marginata (strain CBS 339.88) TaxID=685588 RepID=A0A067T9X6_GALM3|nr:hypothetical protein GALMADRAFT_453378 [Galerina marginata CBS 339.88]